MRIHGILTLVLTAAITGTLFGQPPTSSATAADVGPKTWLTSRSAFNIPFNVSGDDTPVSVELYLSRDGGANWQLHARELPAAGKFHFKAAREGEYWFASRTVAANAPPVNAKELKPELHVYVDWTEPQFEFEAVAGPGGEVEATWSASDPTLNHGSLMLESRTELNGSWQPISLQQRRSKAGKQSVAGKTKWWPEKGTSMLQLRAEIQDRAGNRAIVNRVVLLAGDNLAAPSGGPAVPQDPFSKARELAANGTEWPLTPQEVADDRPPAARELQPRANVRGAAPQQLASNRRTGGESGWPEQEPSSRPLGPGDFIHPQRQPSQPPVTNQRMKGLPEDVRPHMTRSLEFELDYDIESQGVAGVQKVELWGTSDAGATWSAWQEDPDMQSPVAVTVPSEGVFGFRVVVVSTNGLAGTAPRNGDPADVWVGVDETLPTVQLTAARYATEEHFGKLDIRWTLEDQWLVDRPVTLSYADQPTGPWTTIRAGLPNTGQHYWAIGPRTPDEIYLRIEAHDRAGNVGVHQLEQPLRISGLFPKARIRGVRER